MHGINKSGDGEFALEKFLEGDTAPDTISSFTGSYMILFGQNPDERVIRFHNTALTKGLKRSYLVPGFRGNITDSKLAMIREEPFRNRDLTVKISGSNKLIVLDNQMNAVSDEPEHNLVKGLSKPFTIEGYFRHNGYSADFFEMNTDRNWKVSKYGDYGKAGRQYHQLAQKKFDVTYLKGIGFPIHHTGKDGMDTEALVIKKVLQMTSAPQMNQE